MKIRCALFFPQALMSIEDIISFRAELLLVNGQKNRLAISLQITRRDLRASNKTIRDLIIRQEPVTKTNRSMKHVASPPPANLNTIPYSTIINILETDYIIFIKNCDRTKITSFNSTQSKKKTENYSTYLQNIITSSMLLNTYL